MADSSVAVTAGTGTAIDTRTEATNGNHRQVVVVGDPATNAGVAPVDATTGLVVNIAPGVDKGAGTGGSLTPRVIIDSSQMSTNGRAAAASSTPVAISTEDLAEITAVKTAVELIDNVVNSSLAANRTISGGSEYETVAASQTDQILGATGAAGDYIEGLLCVVSTAATSQVQIKDGNGSAITVLPNNVGAGIGSYYVPLGLISVNATTPGWKVTTAAGVAVIGTGNFT